MGSPTRARLVRNLFDGGHGVDPQMAREMRRANIAEAMPGDAVPSMSERQANAQAKEMTLGHIQDTKENRMWPLMPEGISLDAASATGGDVAGTVNAAIVDHARKKYGSLDSLKNGLLGSAPAFHYDRYLTTSVGADARSPMRQGVSHNTAITPITPVEMIDGLTGNRRNTDRSLSRITERNYPDGGDMGETASVYHLGDYPQKLQEPWLVFRGLDPDSFGGSKRAGYSNPITRQQFYNGLLDPYINPSERNRSRINVAQHEAVHSGALDVDVPSKEFLGYQKNRPAVKDRRVIEHPTAEYLASDGRETGNLLFHLKRQTETVNPRMSDIGATRATLDNFLDYARQYKMTGSDPIIGLPGHPQKGQPAHGYEAAMQHLKDILESLGPDGLEDIRDMNFKTSSTTPNVRSALLA